MNIHWLGKGRASRKPDLKLAESQQINQRLVLSFMKLSDTLSVKEKDGWDLNLTRNHFGVPGMENSWSVGRRCREGFVIWRELSQRTNLVPKTQLQGNPGERGKISGPGKGRGRPDKPTQCS